MKKAKEFFLENKVLIAFLIITAIGLFLRFYKIEQTVGFGWDQGRDAWNMRDFLHGRFPLKGPKTGIGDFYLGPIYYYLLAPFYFLTKGDPSASNYFNFIANIINFAAVFYATKKIFSSKIALISILIYATSFYVISKNQIPWNVSLIPAASSLIFLSIWQTIRGNYKWTFALFALMGFFFHLHFTAIFLPSIVFFSLMLPKNRLKIIRVSLFALPLFLVFFVPSAIESLTHYNDNYYRFFNFLKDYLMAPHARFLLHRLPDSLIQIAALLYFPQFFFLRYVIPVVFAALVLVKDRKNKILIPLFALWYVVPLLGFTIYKGPISDYYFMLNLPISIWIIAYITNWLMSAKNTRVVTLTFSLLLIFLAFNTYHARQTDKTKGLKAQREYVRIAVIKNSDIAYKEGDIRSYLFQLAKDRGQTP